MERGFPLSQRDLIRLVPLAALVSTLAALVLVLAGFAFLVTLVLAPASLLFF